MGGDRPTTDINIPINFKGVDAFTLQVWIKTYNQSSLPYSLFSISNNFYLNVSQTGYYICNLSMNSLGNWAYFQLNPISSFWDLVSCSFSINPYRGRITVNNTVFYDSAANSFTSFPALSLVNIPHLTGGSNIVYSLKDLKIWSYYQSVGQILNDVSYKYYSPYTPFLNTFITFDTNCDQITQQCDANYLTQQGITDPTFVHKDWKNKKPCYNLAITGNPSQIIEFIVPKNIWYITREEFSLQVYIQILGVLTSSNCILLAQNLLWLSIIGGNAIQGQIYNPVRLTNITLYGGVINQNAWNYIVLQKIPGNRVSLSVNNNFVISATPVFSNIKQKIGSLSFG